VTTNTMLRIVLLAALALAAQRHHTKIGRLPTVAEAFAAAIEQQRPEPPGRVTASTWGTIYRGGWR
jgi:hypothetical protein